MKAKRLGAVVLTAGFLLSACGGEEVSLIDDKEYTLDEVKELQGDEYYLADAVLWDVLEKYFKDKDEEEKVINEYLESLGDDAKNMTDEEKEMLTDEVVRSVRLNAFYDKYVKVSDEEVKEKMESGYKLYNIYHAVILDGSQETLVKVQEQLAKAKETEDYNQLYVDWSEKGSVSLTYSQYTEDTIMSGFEDALKLKTGELAVFGDDTYQSVMKMGEIIDPTEEDVRLAIRNAKIYSDFTSALDILKVMDEKEKSLLFTDEVYDLMNKDYTGEETANDEATDEEVEDGSKDAGTEQVEDKKDEKADTEKQEEKADESAK